LCLLIVWFRRWPAACEQVRFSEFAERFRHSLLKGREVALDDSPDGAEIYLKIIVNQNITHAGDRAPIYLWMSVLQLR